MYGRRGYGISSSPQRVAGPGTRGGRGRHHRTRPPRCPAGRADLDTRAGPAHSGRRDRPRSSCRPPPGSRSGEAGVKAVGGGPGQRTAALRLAIVYFDSSALVKLLVEEAGSTLAGELWDGCDGAVASRLAYPEVRAALAAATRNHDLAQRDFDLAEAAWEEFWAFIRPVELTPAVERAAGDLARQHALRGADAVHLASALAIGDPALIVAVWDQRLHAGALAAGLSVAPSRLASRRRGSQPRHREDPGSQAGNGIHGPA
jgi:predicted nucleic acid-binding protein